jgi:hypothetical protein
MYKLKFMRYYYFIVKDEQIFLDSFMVPGMSK